MGELGEFIMDEEEMKTIPAQKPAPVYKKEDKKEEPVPKKKQRGSILLKALDTINGERQDYYGNPEDSFDLISDYWKAYLSRKKISELNSHDVCLMMTLFKIAREQYQKKKDNIVDAVGYLGIAGDMHEEK